MSITLGSLKTIWDNTLAKITGVDDKIAGLTDTDGNMKVSQYGNKQALSQEPVTGVKSVTSDAAEIFAGNSRLANRSMLRIRNMEDSLRVRVGKSDVSDTTGYGIEPGGAKEIEINRESDIGVYIISEAGNAEVEVWEA